MGHLSFYNKNQIRDKFLLILIFFEADEVPVKTKQRFGMREMIIGQLR